MTRSLPALAAIGIAALASLAPSVSHAAGLYYADRGVRPLGRAGAFVAGADDLGAIAYNPAGLYDAGGQFLIDGSWVHFSSDYTRVANLTQVDPNTGQAVGTYKETFPTVSGTTPFIPIPTIVGSFKPHKNWVIALGAWAPNAALTTYPTTVAGQPAPQRYSLITLDGSLLALVGGGVAFAPDKHWRLGATFGVLTGVFKTQDTFSGCVPDRFICAPEEPSWDVAAQLNVGPIVAPTGSFGATFIPVPAWRVALAFQLPVWVNAPATLDARLPATPVFEKASQQGDEARVKFDLPWTLRAGIETRAVDNLRLELAFDYDRWSMHDAITVTPENIAFKNVAGFPPTYNVPPVTLPRNFQDSASVHLGGEYTFHADRIDVDARAGVSFETSAIPTAYESVLTIDQNKVTAALGGSVHWRKLRVDFVYAHVFGFDVNVDPAQARISLISPVQANPPKSPDYINGGNYSARADVVGLGLAYTFDPSLQDPSAENPPPAAQPTPQ